MEFLALVLKLLARGLTFGYFAKKLAERKGYDDGFLWGFFLGSIGLLVVKLWPENKRAPLYRPKPPEKLSFSSPAQEKPAEQTPKTAEELTEESYRKACTAMEQAQRETDYLNAAQQLRALGNYKDAAALAADCETRAVLQADEDSLIRRNYIYRDGCSYQQKNTVEAYEKAIACFRLVPEREDAAERIAACLEGIAALQAQEEAERLEAEQRAERERREAVAAAKRQWRKTAVIFMLLLLLEVCCYAGVRLMTPVVRYHRAEQCLQSGALEAAAEGFEALGDYKDAPQRLAEVHRRQLFTAGAGDTVYYGAYEQDGKTDNGAEALQWLVLDKQENRVLLLSCCGIDAVPFHSGTQATTWDNSSLREWMNGFFCKPPLPRKSRDISARQL